MTEFYGKYRRVQKRALPVLLPMLVYWVLRYKWPLAEEPSFYMCNQLYDKILFCGLGGVLLITQIPEAFARMARASRKYFLDNEYWFPKRALPWRTFGLFSLIGLVLCGVLEIVHTVGCGVF